jgi:hypothetical protein
MAGGLKSAKLKLARAAKHLRALKQCIIAYSASQPYKIVAKAKGKKKLNIPKAPPPEICILAGEMIYQMRSALDHLAFDLVQLNATKLTANWFKKCEFPIYITIPKKGNPPTPCSLPVPFNAFERTLPGISTKAFAFIESVQPYYRKGAINNCLRFLAELSNIDKHRYLNVIAPRVRKSESVRYASGLQSTSLHALDRGANFYSHFGRTDSDRAVHVHRRFRAFVTFNERKVLGDAVTVDAEYLLELILNQINTLIVPEFEKLIKNP